MALTSALQEIDQFIVHLNRYALDDKRKTYGRSTNLEANLKFPCSKTLIGVMPHS